MGPVFGHGQLRLYLLVALADGPASGYDIMRKLHDRFAGLYSPSAGTVYPRLGKLEEEGLVRRHAQGRRSPFELTDAGRAELAERADDVARLEADIDAAHRRLAQEMRDRVTSGAAHLREEVDAATRFARDAAALVGWWSGLGADVASGTPPEGGPATRGPAAGPRPADGPERGDESAPDSPFDRFRREFDPLSLIGPFAPRTGERPGAECASRPPTDVGPEHDRSEPRPEQPGSRPSGDAAAGPARADGAGPRPAGSERAGPRPAGSERAGPRPAGSERAGSDQAGSERAGSERAGSERAGSNDGDGAEDGPPAGARTGPDDPFRSGTDWSDLARWFSYAQAAGELIGGRSSWSGAVDRPDVPRDPAPPAADPRGDDPAAAGPRPTGETAPGAETGSSPRAVPGAGAGGEDEWNPFGAGRIPSAEQWAEIRVIMRDAATRIRDVLDAGGPGHTRG